MTDIINILNTDTALTALIGANRVIPDYANDKSPCIVYSFYPTYNDGIKKMYKLTLRIVAATLTACDNIEARVSADLITVGDNQLTNKIISVVQNGGGNLKDADTGLQHRILYFDILKRVN